MAVFDVISVDWGSKRSGIAFGSTENGLVIPYSFKLLTKDIFVILTNEVNNRKTQQFIVGYPTTFFGEKTTISVYIEEFISELALAFPKIKITTVDERNSSKLSRGLIGKSEKHSINHQSACEILKWYLQEINLHKNTFD